MRLMILDNVKDRIIINIAEILTSGLSNFKLIDR